MNEGDTPRTRGFSRASACRVTGRGKVKSQRRAAGSGGGRGEQGVETADSLNEREMLQGPRAAARSQVRRQRG